MAFRTMELWYNLPDGARTGLRFRIVEDVPANGLDNGIGAGARLDLSTALEVGHMVRDLDAPARKQPAWHPGTWRSGTWDWVGRDVLDLIAYAIRIGKGQRQEWYGVAPDPWGDLGVEVYAGTLER
jgi:hypothetical protein